MTLRTNPQIRLAAVIGISAAISFQASCRKPATSQTKAERIGEIDAQLANEMPTGRPEDADKRAALRHERAELAKAAGLQPQTIQVRQNNPSSHADDEKERQRLVALQQESLRNIETRDNERANHEREMMAEATAHSEAAAKQNASHHTYGRTSGYSSVYISSLPRTSYSRPVPQTPSHP
jgi:hypothetical protein